jgi:hypothetical protein
MRAVYRLSFIEVFLISSAVSLIHFLVLGAQFFFFDVVPGGDTQNVWFACSIAILMVLFVDLSGAIHDTT